MRHHVTQTLTRHSVSKNYKALHPCSQGNTSSHLIVNKQMLLHKAIGLVGPECCQDVAVAAVRKHAHSVPQGGLQRCIGEQALQKLHPGTFVKQAFIWFMFSFGSPCKTLY